MRFLSLVLVTCFCWSCNSGVLFEENKAVSEQVWKTENRFSFSVNIEDTINSYNLFLNLRNAKTYAYSNLYLFYHTYSPSGKYELDTLQFILAKPSGEWIGSSSGSLVSNQILFQRNVRFPSSGTYRFELEQGMRNNDLKGISDVGLLIKKSS